MSFEDVVQRFVGINVCLVRHPSLDTVVWNEERKKVTYNFSQTGQGIASVDMFKLRVYEEGAEIFLCIHQPDKRRIGTFDYFDIGLSVLKFVGEGQYSLVGFVSPSSMRQHQLELNPGTLSAGTYIIVPTSTGCRVRHSRADFSALDVLVDATGFCWKCVLSIHCDKKFKLKEVPFDNIAYELAMKLPILSYGDRTDLFGNNSVILFTLRNGFFGNSYAVQNKKTDVCVRLELDFSDSVNVVSESGSLKTPVVVPPNQSMLVHHLAPENQKLGWSSKWKCTGSFLPESEGDGRIGESGTNRMAIGQTWVRIPPTALVLSVDYDEDVIQEDGREYVGNLTNDGTQRWNKWYSGAQSGDQATITVKFVTPQRVDRYSIKW